MMSTPEEDAEIDREVATWPALTAEVHDWLASLIPRPIKSAAGLGPELSEPRNASPNPTPAIHLPETGHGQGTAPDDHDHAA